jgi:hypothetical protein
VADSAVEETSLRVPAEEGEETPTEAVVVRAFDAELDEAPLPRSSTAALAATTPVRPATSMGRNSRLMGHLRVGGMRR